MITREMKKILVVLPPTIRVGPRGFWTLEALKTHYNVYALNIGKISWEENGFWGTHVNSKEVKLIEINPFLLSFSEKLIQVKYSLIGRHVQKIASDFDIVLSAYNIMDFGKRGIQFLGDLIFDDKLKNYLYPYPEKREAGWFYKKSIIRYIYLKLSNIIYNPSDEMMWKNLTIANSKWTKNLIKKEYGIDCKVIYPPVIDNEYTIDWEDKENGFICLSQIVPFKQVDRAIEIVSGLRKAGFKFHLHIVGPEIDSVYSSQIKRYCLENREWCFFEGAIFGNEKQKLIAKHKFGLNCCQNEAFGMAVGEMIKSGALVWVPNGGGQVEIVGHPLLIYDDIHDAIKKIMKVSKDVSVQNNLRNHLADQSARFSTEKFKKEVRNTVKGFIDRKLD